MSRKKKYVWMDLPLYVFLGMLLVDVAGGILAAILLGHGAMVVESGRLVTLFRWLRSFVSFFMRLSNGLPCKEEEVYKMGSIK